jgi:hypothetical protein
VEVEKELDRSSNPWLGLNLDMVFLVKVKLPVVLQHWRRRVPRASPRKRCRIACEPTMIMVGAT